MREVIMAGDYWCIPRKGGSRSGRPSTNWLIETAGQAWKKYKLYDSNNLAKALQERKKNRKKNITPEQAKTKKKRQQEEN